jgi:tripartite-type tricarboxylate transporter receptor subunit TctC
MGTLDGTRWMVRSRNARCLPAECFEVGRAKAPSLAAALAFAGFVAALATMTSTDVHAQAKYPERPIRLVVPFSPGGNTDIVARLYTARLSPLLGQSVVVDNKAGADGAIGSTEVARAKPDGYTLLMGTVSTHSINPLTMENLGYDPIRDFAPIAVLGTVPIAVAVHPSGAKTLKELIDLVKANPGKYSYGTPGLGSLNHLTGELFKKRAGDLNIVHIPYKGGGQSVTDLVAGQIPISMVTFSSAVQQHKNGRVRILAVFSEKRAQAAPDVPTAIEAGLPGVLGYTYTAIFAPAGTSKPIIDTLYSATAKVMNDDSWQKSLIAQTVEPVTDSTPATMVPFMRAELDKWAEVLKAIGGKAH